VCAHRFTHKLRLKLEQGTVRSLVHAQAGAQAGAREHVLIGQAHAGGQRPCCEACVECRAFAGSAALARARVTRTQGGALWAEGLPNSSHAVHMTCHACLPQAHCRVLAMLMLTCASKLWHISSPCSPPTVPRRRRWSCCWGW